MMLSLGALLAAAASAQLAPAVAVIVFVIRAAASQRLILITVRVCKGAVREGG
jgi:hypothetical protein